MAHTHKLTMVTTLNNPWTDGLPWTMAVCDCGAEFYPEMTYDYPIIGAKVVDLMGRAL